METKHDNIHKPLHKIFINNFVGGIAWGLGATVGAGILLAIFGFLLSKINLIPVIGGFASDIFKFVVYNNPNLIK